MSEDIECLKLKLIVCIILMYVITCMWYAACVILVANLVSSVVGWSIVILLSLLLIITLIKACQLDQKCTSLLDDQQHQPVIVIINGHRHGEGGDMSPMPLFA